MPPKKKNTATPIGLGVAVLGNKAEMSIYRRDYMAHKRIYILSDHLQKKLTHPELSSWPKVTAPE